MDGDAARRLAADLAPLAPPELFADETWRACADAGLTSGPIPVEDGGAGSSLLDAAAGLQAFAAAGAPAALVFALGAQLWSVAVPLARFGTADQRGHWLTGLCRGVARGAHAMTEPSSGSDAFSITTAVTPSGDVVQLDGVKTFVTSAPHADVFLVFATADPAAGWSAIECYVVPRDAPGLEVRDLATASPVAAPMGELVLDACRVPADHRLGGPRSGMAIFSHSMELERSFLAAGLLGLSDERARRLLRAGAAAAPGVHASTFLGRLLVDRAASPLAAGRRAAHHAALAKLSASQTWVRAANAAVDAAGAAGMLAPAALDVLDGAASLVYSGTSEVQRDLLGRSLGL